MGCCRQFSMWKVGDTSTQGASCIPVRHFQNAHDPARSWCNLRMATPPDATSNAGRRRSEWHSDQRTWRRPRLSSHNPNSLRSPVHLHRMVFPFVPVRWLESARSRRTALQTGSCWRRVDNQAKRRRRVLGALTECCPEPSSDSRARAPILTTRRGMRGGKDSGPGHRPGWRSGRSLLRCPQPCFGQPP